MTTLNFEGRVLFGWPGWTSERMTIEDAEAKLRAKPWWRYRDDMLLWRVVAQSYSYTIDADTDTYGSSDPQLELHPVDVLKWTPCGATINWPGNGRRKFRWVDLREDAKQFASRTPAEALDQFAAKCRRRIYVLQRKLARAEQELALTQGLAVFPAPSQYSTLRKADDRPHAMATA